VRFFLFQNVYNEIQWVEFGEEHLAKKKSVFYDVIDVMTQDYEK